jgi:hypothetical protein
MQDRITKVYCVFLLLRTSETVRVVTPYFTGNGFKRTYNFRQIIHMRRSSGNLFRKNV